MASKVTRMSISMKLLALFSRQTVTASAIKLLGHCCYYNDDVCSLLQPLQPLPEGGKEEKARRLRGRLRALAGGGEVPFSNLRRGKSLKPIFPKKGHGRKFHYPPEPETGFFPIN